MQKKNNKAKIPTKKTNTKKSNISNTKKITTTKNIKITKPTNNKNIKKDIKEKKQIKDITLSKNTKIALLIIVLAILVVTYFTLGLFFTVFIAFGFGLIFLVQKLLKVTKHSKTKRRILNAIIILILLICIAGVVAVSSFGMYIAKISDKKFDKKKLHTSEMTIIYDKDGNEIIKLGSEMREKVTYNELPEVLVDAIVATEDSRFFQHNGFDAARFVKAAGGQALGHSDAGGASTLSMQVIKNQITSTEASGMKGIIRKFQDIYLSVFKLEKNYTKQEIIEFYVNNHFLGGNIYGVQEAAKTYFGKDVSELNLSEAAILAGMFKSPNAYRPTVNPENATKRRKTVLYLMKKHGYITAEEEKLANSVPVESLIVEAENQTDTPYQAYIDTVVDEIEDKYGVDAYTTPLLVYTNLDRSRQDGVNKVLNGETYNWIDDKVQSGVSVLESESGKILAIGGGRNRSGAKTWNYATQIKRQPGSTAKPLFDYGPGIEYNNWSTYTLFDDAPYSYSNGRSIKNWDGGYYGTITLRRALSTSRNIPALKAFQQVDNKKIVDFVTKLGITPEVENGKIHEAHSIGAFTGVSPLIMSGAYAAFSNGGYYNEPYSVSKIVFRDTDEVKEHTAENYVVKRKVMSDATAYMISSVLQDVALTGGTPTNVACKTGTTNFDENTMSANNMPYDAIRDSWVVGYSTKTTIGMWYGYDNFTKESIKQGYVLHNIPATIQKDRLFKALVSSGAMESNRQAFNQPSSVVKLGIIQGSNPPIVVDESYTGGVVYEYFKKDHQPDAIAQTKLNAPANLKATYENNKVHLSWNAVDPGNSGNAAFGTFGYNIYRDSTLIGFTDKTTYDYSTTSPDATYKVVATYKSYSGIQSNAATVTIKNQNKKDEEQKTQEVHISGNYTGSTTFNAGDTIPINSISITNNAENITSSVTNKKAIDKATGKEITTFPTDKQDITIEFKGTYNGKEYTILVRNFKITPKTN